jgi:hypothetical protein
MSGAGWRPSRLERCVAGVFPARHGLRLALERVKVRARSAAGRRSGIGVDVECHRGGVSACGACEYRCSSLAIAAREHRPASARGFRARRRRVRSARPLGLSTHAAPPCASPLALSPSRPLAPSPPRPSPSRPSPSRPSPLVPGPWLGIERARRSGRRERRGVTECGCCASDAGTPAPAAGTARPPFATSAGAGAR